MDIEKLEHIVNNEKIKYYVLYSTPPKYLKLPLGVFKELKKYMKEISDFYIDYETKAIKYMGLIICDTVSINNIEDIEVF